MTARLNDRTLFDQDHVPDEERQQEKQRQQGSLDTGVNRGPDHPAFDDEDDTSDVEEYMRRKDRQEQEERQQGSDLHGQATAGASAVYLLRWALSDADTKEDEPTLPAEARKEAQRCKARLDALERARMTTDPTAENFVALRDSAHDAWPFDDDPMEVPHSSTDRADYEAYLASEWKARWRHLVPTRIIKEAKEADPSFL